MLLLDGQIHHDTHAIPMGNYVIGVGNYVIATPSKLGNYVSADTIMATFCYEITVELGDLSRPDRLKAHTADPRFDVAVNQVPVILKRLRLDLHSMSLDPLIKAAPLRSAGSGAPRAGLCLGRLARRARAVPSRSTPI